MTKDGKKATSVVGRMGLQLRRAYACIPAHSSALVPPPNDFNWGLAGVLLPVFASFLLVFAWFLPGLLRVREGRDVCLRWEAMCGVGDACGGGEHGVSVWGTRLSVPIRWRWGWRWGWSVERGAWSVELERGAGARSVGCAGRATIVPSSHPADEPPRRPHPSNQPSTCCIDRAIPWPCS